MQTAQKGVITRILPNRGFGFIRGDDGLSRFFHAGAVVPASAFDTLREGTAVEFHAIDGVPEKGNGLRANAIRVLVP